MRWSTLIACGHGRGFWGGQSWPQNPKCHASRVNCLRKL